MNIYVVKEGDSIYSIANENEVSVTRLAQEHGLTELNGLVVGQALVIAEPEETYIVKEGDSLLKIANEHNITMLQLIQNNPALMDRDYIFPG